MPSCQHPNVRRNRSNPQRRDSQGEFRLNLMRKKRNKPAPSGIPAWFMTYSDVITLLMTFFILLLTFATNEPEQFERMKVAVFGGGGGTGLIGENNNPLEYDSTVVRFRPRSARQTMRGTELPPLHEEPATASVTRGLEALEELTDLVRAERCQITMRREHLINDGRITNHGEATLRIICSQLRRFNGHAQLIAANSEDALALIPVCLDIAEETRAYPGSFAVSTRETNDPEQRRMITILVTRDIR